MDVSRRDFLAVGLGIACSPKGEVLDALAKAGPSPVAQITVSSFVPWMASLSLISGVFVSSSSFLPSVQHSSLEMRMTSSVVYKTGELHA